MALKKVKVEDSVGMVLSHDITKIVPGEYKGPLFKKGHIIRSEDIEHLKNVGKEHIYLVELLPGQLHENDAVHRMAAAVAGNNTVYNDPAEGKISIRASVNGLLKINREAVKEINMIDCAVLSTLHSNRVVNKDDLIAGVKVVPLVVGENIICEVERIGKVFSPVIQVKPLKSMQLGVVITGNEVYYGRIKDRFAPVFTEKAARYGLRITEVIFTPDNKDQITAAILKHKQAGAELVVAAGGMSVDPDDITPEAIRATGAAVVTYGTPVLPGAMFMLAYLNDLPIMGMPACGMYAKTTVFDLILPRLLAGERLNKKDIAELGYGGLCVACAECSFPHCPFGK